MSEDLKYPIGKFDPSVLEHEDLIANTIEQIKNFPELLALLVKNFTIEQVNTPYREGGWTVKQVIHHLADTQMNIFIRLKLAITENNPTVKPFNENLWSETKDGLSDDIDSSIKILEGIHQKLYILLKSMSPSDFERCINHPERGLITIKWVISFYTWHCYHHLAHISSLCKRNNWI